MGGEGYTFYLPFHLLSPTPNWGFPPADDILAKFKSPRVSVDPVIHPSCPPPAVGIKNEVLKWQQLGMSVGGQTCQKAPANQQCTLETGPVGGGC